MIYRTKDLEEKQAKRLVNYVHSYNVVSSTTDVMLFFFWFASSAGFGMRRGYLLSFTSPVVCQAISQHGNGYCHGKGKSIFGSCFMFVCFTLLSGLNLAKNIRRRAWIGCFTLTQMS